MSLPPIQEKPNAEIIRGLNYDDPNHNSAVLSNLAMLLKEGQFCDASLIVGDHETGIHRAVVASSSGFFFDLFSKSREDGKESKDQFVFKLKEILWDTFSYLLDFMYTGRLCVKEEDVAAVYKLAKELRIPAASDACAQFITGHLTPDNCLGTRMFAADSAFREKVDSFIGCNIKAVTNSKKFYGLSKVSLEIVGTDENLVVRTNHEELLPEVLVWLRQKMATLKNNLESLTEDMIVLYLNTDNTLTDCADVDHDTNLKQSGLVQDYKKLNKKKQSGQPKGLSTPDRNGMANYRKFSINPEKPIVEMEWSVVASMKTKDRTYISIVVLNGVMGTLLIHYRSATSMGEGSDDPESPVNTPNGNKFESLKELIPMASMTTNRCAFGLKALKGELFACGGYDRGECLKSSEVYNIATNEWQVRDEMKSPRGRFSIGLHDEKIYACGGSSGNCDVKIFECYDSDQDKWTIVGELPKAKASPGIVVLQGKLYILGGCIGQSTVATCESFDLTTCTWHSVPAMNIPRYQVAVTVIQNKIYAIGGTNGWQCLNEVEVYDPETREWTFCPPMNIARRGAGVDIYDGKIYVVGGNDGMSALNSMEIYNPDTCNWNLGPMLSCPRANCGVACLDGKLFAVGGYSGKKFLSSMELLEIESADTWSCYIPSASNNAKMANGAYGIELCGKMAAVNMNGSSNDLKIDESNRHPLCANGMKQDIKTEGERNS